MMWTWLGNGLLGWVMTITFCFCVTDTISVLTTPLGTPFIQVFVDTTKSVGGATALTVLMLVIAIFACAAVVAASSRQVFAFARDDGIPFGQVFSKVCGFQCPSFIVEDIILTFCRSRLSGKYQSILPT